MKLSKKDLKALAREARRLASECVEGTHPAFTHWDYCGCAVGTVVRRSGLDDQTGAIAISVDELLIDPPTEDEFGTQDPWAGLVSIGLRDHGPGGAVFPLLALADELEKASKASRDRRSPP